VGTANQIDNVPASACSKHAIRLLQTGETYMCGSAETLLQGMARIGRKGIPAGCLNGGCGVCKVVIRSGSVTKTGAMSRAHVSEQEEAQGVVLAAISIWK
jgi:ferredoxin